MTIETKYNLGDRVKSTRKELAGKIVAIFPDIRAGLKPVIRYQIKDGESIGIEIEGFVSISESD